MKIPGHFSAEINSQTAEICGKIDDLLAKVGSSKEKLLTATIFISDFSKKNGMNDAWLDWLPGEILPPRAIR